MEFWIENGDLVTWLDQNRRIQEKVVTRGVVDVDFSSSLNEWLVTRPNGTVETIGVDSQIRKRTYSQSGVSARWNGTSLVIREVNGKSKVYNYDGFLTQTL
jgi:hypothetical protein